jgi:hypothetical protein
MEVDPCEAVTIGDVQAPQPLPRRSRARHRLYVAGGVICAYLLMAYVIAPIPHP